MAVNGSGMNDSTQWTVRTPDGTVERDSKNKPLVGLKAADAFAEVRKARRVSGKHLVAVRT